MIVQLLLLDGHVRSTKEKQCIYTFNPFKPMHTFFRMCKVICLSVLKA